MTYLEIVLRRVRAHMAEVREQARKDGGYSTEAVIITALLAILALGAIAAKVMSKANGIDLGGK